MTTAITKTKTTKISCNFTIKKPKIEVILICVTVTNKFEVSKLSFNVGNLQLTYITPKNKKIRNKKFNFNFRSMRIHQST